MKLNGIFLNDADMFLWQLADFLLLGKSVGSMMLRPPL
jgi:hypothetical protein